jgi:hypothetical protein
MPQELPYDLLDAILQCAPFTESDLMHLALVSKLWREVAQDHLYRSLSFRSQDERSFDSIEAFLRTLQTTPLGELTQSLAL